MASRLAAEVGLGQATIAAANRIGHAYASAVFGCGPYTVFALFNGRLPFALRSAHDNRTYKKLCKAGLAFADVLTYIQVPVINKSGDLEYQAWPILQPHHLVQNSFALCQEFVDFVCDPLWIGIRWMHCWPMATEISWGMLVINIGTCSVRLGTQSLHGQLTL